MVERKYYIGVDVGTGSARAAIVRDDGCIVAEATKEIKIWHPEPYIYEQSSENIWSAVTGCVNKVLAESGVDKTSVFGIGFDATCSLVVLDKEFKPVRVNKTGDEHRDIIMWMDHRASEQTKKINLTNHKVLDNVGGSMSLEMQPPKLLWLKENLKDECWSRAAHFFDLPDFLTWRATGSLSRSMCSLVCKWGYMLDAVGLSSWSDSFLHQTGLDDLILDNYSKIGNEVKSPGSPCGEGLTQKAAAELGLLEETPVGTSLIDAHAGGVGSLACSVYGPNSTNCNFPLCNRLAFICGTSSCHMAVSNEPRYVSGVWGPYFSAMIPGMWLNEGGQSATGKLLDHIVETHQAFPELEKITLARGTNVFVVLNDILKDLASKKRLSSLSHLTENLHLWPDFYGNRAPLADPTLRGMICGLSLSANIEDLALLYLAAVQALAYGTKHILEELKVKGQEIKVIYMCGGLRENPLFVSMNADVTGMPVVLPEEKKSVLIGAAVLGACASENHHSILTAMKAMGGRGEAVNPNLDDFCYHKKKYQVFRNMVEDQMKYRAIMSMNFG